MTVMIAPRMAILVALLLAACGPGRDPLPEPAVKWPPAPPTITPIPAPDPLCIAQMDSHSRPPEPRKIRHVPPRFPRLSQRTRSLVPFWLGVAEIGTDGRVAHVRTVRPIKADPPWPELQESILAAVRQWEYEPACVDGHPAKVELTISVHIEFR